jgi:hypothetical protein
MGMKKEKTALIKSYLSGEQGGEGITQGCLWLVASLQGCADHGNPWLHVTCDPDRVPPTGMESKIYLSSP